MTPEFPFLKGTFQLAGSAVPYMQLSLSARDALRYLRVARDLIFDPSEIVLDELFQRDIDDARVQREIAPYLLREGELKFFNSLVVVLLPHESERLRADYVTVEGTNHNRQLRDIQMRQHDSGGTICWDTSAICAVIVDGQHRFAALQKVAEGASADMEQDLGATTVPVTALALHESLGFRGNKTNLLSTVRKIFIDLNRQAKTVSETRNILLDDRDLAAIATRSLLEKRVKSNEESLAIRLQRGRMPLALVDWYSDKVKFDHGVHITSILTLYQIVSDSLRLPKVDPYDYDKAGQLFRRFLEFDSGLEFGATLEDCRENKQPVFLREDDVRAFATWFESDWGPAIAHVLTGIAPYAAVVQELVALEFLDGSLEPWAAMDRAGKAIFQRTYGDALAIPNRESRVSEKKAGDLAFQVVFQRGVMRAFMEMFQVHRELAEGAGHSASAQVYAEGWVEGFNSRIGNLTRDRGFWKGSMIRSDGSINAARTAEKAVAATVIIILLAPFSDWRSTEDSHGALVRATDHACECAGLKDKRGLNPWEKLRKTSVEAWRSLLRKLVEETDNLYGPGVSEAISRRMGQTIKAAFDNSDIDESTLTEEKRYGEEGDLAG